MKKRGFSTGHLDGDQRKQACCRVQPPLRPHQHDRRQLESNTRGLGHKRKRGKKLKVQHIGLAIEENGGKNWRGKMIKNQEKCHMSTF